MTISKFDLDLLEELVEGGILWAEGTSVEVDSSLVQKKSKFVNCNLYVSNFSQLSLSFELQKRYYLQFYLTFSFQACN